MLFTPKLHRQLTHGLALALATVGVTTAALAHITLENGKAAAGAAYKAVFRVPHGCAGKATVAVRVRIPEGVIAVKPMPKAGWQLATVKGKYAKPYDYYGATLTEGVVEVDWTGGSLPDEWYDEFVLRGQLAGFAPGAIVHFPVVQECADGLVERWIEIPAAGKAADDDEHPAPALTIVERPAE